VPVAGVTEVRPFPGPLVSCIMPTLNRRRFVPLAIASFLRQDYPAKELVIVDSGTDPVADLIPEHPSIVYRRAGTGMPLGAVRNLACTIATGEVIAFWDDDDWHAPDRLALQVHRLVTRRAGVCGATSLLYFAPEVGRAWRFTWPPGHGRWLAGQTLCFTRKTWERTPFPPTRFAEDAGFVCLSAAHASAVVANDDSVIALVHAHNTVPKTGRGVFCAPVSPAEVQARLGPDAELYRRSSAIDG
jgi:glycosyltransferase involved in cell wall biosynthesis